MLNDLFDAAKNLKNVGVNTESWHQNYKLVPNPSKNRPTFFVFIGSEGKITCIEPVIEPNDIKRLRKWEIANGQSFPYFNITPLWEIKFDPGKDNGDKRFKRDLGKRTISKQQLQKFIHEKTCEGKEWERKHIERLGKCLAQTSTKLQKVIDDPPNELRAIKVLIERVRTLPADKFYSEIKKAFRCKMLQDPSSAGMYFKGVFSWDKKRKNTVSILLELDDRSRFEYPVKHNRVCAWINKRLLEADQNNTQHSDQLDVFGNDSAGCDARYPDVKVKHLGAVKLRAMNYESPCQFRYRTIGQDSCLVGGKSRMSMKEALEWLTDPCRMGETWTMISKKEKEIFVAYLSELPEHPPAFADMFGGTDGADAASRFEECAEKVIDMLNGLMPQNPSLDFRAFMLRKMDRARTRVSSHWRYNAQHLINAARNWQNGCRNISDIPIKQATQNGRDEWRKPQMPFPMDVVRVLNTVWPLVPTRMCFSVKGITAEDGISLLLEKDVLLEPVVRRMLSAATRNTAGLVLALGRAHAQGQVFADARRGVTLPSILGLLLFKMDITKEEYMKSPPYLIGRLLSLADQLHYHYCDKVRKQNVPQQLMGNALMPTALEEPIKALAIYCNRILPYQAWARTVPGDDARLARYFLGELGKVCSELGGPCSGTSVSNAIPERCSEADKAQMLIGYLARPEKSYSETTK